ncbi:hypothetical protein IQ266_19245 [filamentous cyanobacterium LEGE 11480]|uniref:Uncharacterized protein n=1 Tax=Romeriopsis navalis LEGE 11480 TaxID=2777977 RepID=A0A928VTC9_9CYAN|nr:hypothetical protein [Romeriopsis navalis]MBE9031874.1 hypothetical protein [Romeriopsis navalis LEGE 11480]
MNFSHQYQELRPSRLKLNTMALKKNWMLKSHRRRSLLPSLLTLTIATPAVATITPGNYGPLDLAYDPVTQAISSHFSPATAAGKFQCRFFITGSPTRPNTYRITSWLWGTHDGTGNGTLTASQRNGIPTVQIKLDREYGGCWNATSLRFKSVATLNFRTTKKIAIDSHHWRAPSALPLLSQRKIPHAELCNQRRCGETLGPTIALFPGGVRGPSRNYSRLD